MNKLTAAARISVSLVLTVTTATFAYADVGRLFFTPSERAAFERARGANEPDPVQTTVAPEATIQIIDAAPQEPKQAITIDGYVRRSDGNATLWVNGENNYDGDLSAGWIEPRSARLRNGEVYLKPMDGDPTISLKPGQSYNPNSTTIRDAYETPVLADELGSP